MSAPRTVTLATLDAGTITIPEPSWCTGHAGHPVECRVDVGHFGPITPFCMPTSRGEIVTMEAALCFYPYADSPTNAYDLVRMWVGMEGDGYPSDPPQLDAMAAALVEHASILRALARDLARLRAGEGAS